MQRSGTGRTATAPLKAVDRLSLYRPLDFLMVRAPLLPLEVYAGLSADEPELTLWGGDLLRSMLGDDVPLRFHGDAARLTRDLYPRLCEWAGEWSRTDA